jgi:hypothetical protein
VFAEEYQSITAETNPFVNVLGIIEVIIAMSKCFSKTMLKNSYVSRGMKISLSTGGKDLRNLEYHAELAHGRVGMANCVNKINVDVC